MQYYFKTREQYIIFLERLLKISDEVRVVDDTPSGENFNIPLNEKVEKIFRKYNLFLEIGYDEEYEYGVSMAFYKKGDFIFLVYAYDLI